MTRFANVQRREPICDQADAIRLQRRALSRTQAKAKVEAKLAEIFDGCSGPFANDLLEALIAAAADRAVSHRDTAFANSRLGYHAGRVGRDNEFTAEPAEIIMARVRAGLRQLRDEEAA